MNERRRLFVSEFSECGDAALAAVRAGYSPRAAASVGRRLLGLPEVRDLLSSLAVSEVPAEKPVSVDWVVREARRTYDAAHEAGSLSTAVSCLTLIGRHLEAKGAAEPGEGGGVAIVTGIEGAPGSYAHD